VRVLPDDAATLATIQNTVFGVEEGRVRFTGAPVDQFDPLLTGFAAWLEAAPRRGRSEVLITDSTALAALTYIHPFADGNGRTGRAILHWAQLVAGFDLATPALELHYLWERRGYERTISLTPAFAMDVDPSAFLAWNRRMAGHVEQAARKLVQARTALATSRALARFFPRAA
jgi:Fic family protein